MSKPKPKHRRPTAAEMDERVSIPLPTDDLVEGILQAGPHPDEDEKKAPTQERGPSR